MPFENSTQYFDSHLNNIRNCGQYSYEDDVGCSFETRNERLNTILVIVYVLVGTLIICTNVMLFCLFLKRRDSVWTFATYYFVLLLFYDLLGGLATYVVAFSTCQKVDDIYLVCMTRYCLLYFIGLMLNEINLMISLEILINIRWNSIYKRLFKKLYTVAFNFLTTFLAVMFAFAPIIFKWNYFDESCECGHNNVLSSRYILINNSIFFISSIATIIVYFYIYLYAKQSRKRIANHFSSFNIISLKTVKKPAKVVMDQNDNTKNVINTDITFNQTYNQTNNGTGVESFNFHVTNYNSGINEHSFNIEANEMKKETGNEAGNFLNVPVPATLAVSSKQTSLKNRLHLSVLSLSRITNERPSGAANQPQATNANVSTNVNAKINKKPPSKINVLKVQTFIFMLFLICWFPYQFIVTFEAFNDIETYTTLSKIRNFSVSLIMINAIICPIVYAYRFKFMRSLFS